MPSMMPRGPRTTCSISFGPGRQVATTSQAAATSAGQSAHCAPAARRRVARSGRTSWTVSWWPARKSWPAIGRPMLPTPMKPTFTAWPILQRVEPQDVVPEDLLLARAADGEREKALHGFRILRIAVGIVGGGHEVIVSEGVDDVLDELLVALHGAEALAAKVVRGRQREMGHLAVRLAPLVVLVHPVEPERKPAALGLQKREVQAGEALHDSTHDDVEAGEHLLHGMG